MQLGSAIFLILVSFSCSAEEDFVVEDFITASVEGLQIQSDSHDATWGIREAETWDVDQDAGTISWLFADGKVAVAPVQIIGTYNPNDRSFMWGWDHPSVVPELQESAKLVKEFGAKHEIPSFMQQKIVLQNESEAWKFVAVANRLAESNGGYRADTGGPIVFMTYGEITLRIESP
jgi:hypothetical protein